MYLYAYLHAHTHIHKPNQKQNLRLLKYSELSITYLTINKQQTYLTSGAKTYATYTSLPRDPLGLVSCKIWSDHIKAKFFG